MSPTHSIIIFNRVCAEIMEHRSNWERTLQLTPKPLYSNFNIYVWFQLPKRYVTNPDH